PPAPIGCTTSFESFQSSTDYPIPDEGVITSTLEVSGVGISLWDVNVTPFIQHTYNADLDIYLISPSGTKVTLTTDNGGANDNVFDGTTWDDQWVGPSVGDYVYTNNTIALNMSPEEAMGAFIGENPNGIWKLVIHDDAADDTGTLYGWFLDITALPIEPDILGGFYAENSGVTLIPDGNTLEVSISFNPSIPITHLNFQTTIEHTNNADLDMYLVSPDGLITVTLTTDNGGIFDNVFNGTYWNDYAGLTNSPGAVSDTDFANDFVETPLVPENAMSAFTGEMGGFWKLIIVDDTVGETGTFLGWKMNSQIQSCTPDLITYQSGIAGSYTVPLGQPINYVIKTANEGPALAHNVMMTDTLPANTFFQSFTPAPGWTCDTPNVGENGPITCQTPSLAPGALVTHTLQLQPINVPQPLEDNLVNVSTSDEELITDNNLRGYQMLITYLSANGNFWDVQDALYFWETGPDNQPVDNGAVEDTGQDAFDSWGGLALRIMDEANTILLDNEPLTHFGLSFTGDGWRSNTPQTYGDILVSRALYAPNNINYIRYLDTFTNTSNAVRQVVIAWGGNLGSDDGTILAATSSGDLTFDPTDAWALTIENYASNPNGPATDPAVGYVFRGPGDTSYLGPVDTDINPFENPWPGNGQDDLGYAFAFTLQPGETTHLLYFVYRGLSEEETGPEGCITNCVTPPAGSEMALAQTVIAALAVQPEVCDLPADVRTNLINWPDLNVDCSVSVYLPIVVR
ncbi:MAG TPA: proprotein convertase P-domain-containing protein, partial [Anaerolineales bacterium]|nr:proprotein convertase P-domain-containing protein [Anaerolineales bacterium]